MFEPKKMSEQAIAKRLQIAGMRYLTTAEVEELAAHIAYQQAIIDKLRNALRDENAASHDAAHAAYARIAAALAAAGGGESDGE